MAIVLLHECLLSAVCVDDFLCSAASGGGCSTTVLLTERCQPQSLMLKQMLERMGQPLPPELGEMVQNALKVCSALVKESQVSL